MKNRKLFILSAITIVVIIAASITATLQAPQVKRNKNILLPELASRINDVTVISIKGNQHVLNLRKQNDIWVIENADNYPAIFEKVKDTVISLSTLMILAEKTDNPEFYSRLGVEDPGTNQSRSLLVTLKDNSESEISAIIIGAQRHSKSASSSPGLYVRRPNEAKALLVEGNLRITDNITDWFNRDILDIPSSMIREVSIQHTDGDLLRMMKKNREAPEFELQNYTEQKKSVFKIILNRISKALEELRANGVKSINQFKFPEDAVITQFNTFNGMIINVKSAKVDNKSYAHFSFDIDNSIIQDADDNVEETQTTDRKTSVEAEVRIYNSVLSEWVFEIPDFKYQDLTKRLDSITNINSSGLLKNGDRESVNTMQKLDFP